MATTPTLSFLTNGGTITLLPRTSIDTTVTVVQQTTEVAAVPSPALTASPSLDPAASSISSAPSSSTDSTSISGSSGVTTGVSSMTSSPSSTLAPTTPATTTSLAPTSSNSQGFIGQSSGGGLSDGAVGAIVAVCVLVPILLLATFLLLRRKQKLKQDRPTEGIELGPMPGVPPPAFTGDGRAAFTSRRPSHASAYPPSHYDSDGMPRDSVDTFASPPSMYDPTQGPYGWGPPATPRRVMRQISHPSLHEAFPKAEDSRPSRREKKMTMAEALAESRASWAGGKPF